ncbi:MAG TPA: DUF1800 domain-containing protein [Abditibacteriaceae bacterium]|jgi:hypothetical protein
MQRRDLLQFGALTAAGMLLPGCSRVVRRALPVQSPDSIALPQGDVAPLVRLVNRVSFGPRPGDLARIAAMGLTRYIDEQLNADDREDMVLTARLHSVEVFQTSAIELGDLPERAVVRQLQQAALLRAVYSRHQLRERMVDFWSNHFNIYAHKGWGAYFKPLDEMQVVRRHALGMFPDMLRASAHSPAMLSYLDNQTNRRGVPNENYARELMELHTLGVDGGYTQKDVQEVARCFTGWTVEDRFLRRRGNFRFDPAQHDDGPKTVLGLKIPPGGGQQDAERVLAILAEHPATARFIARKLCRYFVGEENSHWVSKLAAIYLQTKGDIKAMLRPLLLSPQLLHAPPIVKRPFDFMVSALRTLNADTAGSAQLQEHLARMGQPLYLWPMPDGYPSQTAAWTGSLLARWNFASALAHGEVGGTSVDLSALASSDAIAHDAADSKDHKQVRALAQIILPGQAATDRYTTLLKQLANHSVQRSEVAALLLCSPQFQWR